LAINLCGISEAADKLIVDEETGGQAYYEARETHPTWPGGASGVTIGCGYDCGYSSAQRIAEDWGTLLPLNTLKALQGVAGVTGTPAKALAHELHWIVVSWDVALQVFHSIDLPRWTARVKAALPNCDKLNGDCFGALVSLAFNRGTSFDLLGTRYTEMRSIKEHMQKQEFERIPNEFLAMRRLWPKNGDLWKRREHEATLFTKGLVALRGAPPTA
jgi:hypothetical protein